VNRVLVEGGSMVAGEFLREGLVDRLHLFVAPKAIGRGKDLFEGLGGVPIERALRLSIEGTRRAGEDLEIRLVRRG
jgi:diaminohydroxyphosphoribosylaminopyrimidine deaminase/5-amino-6-(5-phosphoribosylamino)uracil reductase